jgi:hypothetical protein
MGLLPKDRDRDGNLALVFFRSANVGLDLASMPGADAARAK